MLKIKYAWSAGGLGTKLKVYTQSVSRCSEAHAQTSRRHCEEFTTKQSGLPRSDDGTRNDVATKPQLERSIAHTQSISSCGEAQTKSSSGVYLNVNEQRRFSKPTKPILEVHRVYETKL